MMPLPKGPECRALAEHPRWHWAFYPARWLTGGCWSLGQALGTSALYGLVFGANAWVWNWVFARLTSGGLGLALFLTAWTLLLAPALTVSLWRVTASGRGNDLPSRAALFELGLLLVLLLSVFLDIALFAFVLLYQGPVPELEKLPAALLSAANTPLLLAWLLVLATAALCMQAVAALPTLVLGQGDTSLVEALRRGGAAILRNWRPLSYWALGAQFLLFVVGALLPASLLVLAPTIANGTWWAYREISTRPRPLQASGG